MPSFKEIKNDAEMEQVLSRYRSAWHCPPQFGSVVNSVPPRRLGEFIKIEDAARVMACSYGEARNRILDGRIQGVKDGRWIRTKLEWIQEYLNAHIVEGQTIPSIEALPRSPTRKPNVKLGATALNFLRQRKS